MEHRISQGKSRAFTLIELLVVVAIIAILVAILVPSLSRARQQAYRVKCAANLKALGMGLMYYADDNNDYMPDMRGAAGPPGYWAEQIGRYVKIKRSKVGSRNGLLRCPSDENPPYFVITGPQAGQLASEKQKIQADRGESASGGGHQPSPT